MSKPRNYHSCCVLVNNQIVVTGSSFNVKDDNVGESVEIYDCQKDKWGPLPSMHHPRYNHSSCSMNDKFIYVYGGRHVKTGETVNQLERLSVNGLSFIH